MLVRNTFAALLGLLFSLQVHAIAYETCNSDIFIDDFTIRAGQTQWCEIKMHNDLDFTLAECYIILPAGLTFEGVESFAMGSVESDDYYLSSLSYAYHASEWVNGSGETIPGHSISVFARNDRTWAPGQWTIGLIGLSANENIANGDQLVFHDPIRFANSNETAWQATPTHPTTITVAARGDINADGMVDVSDIDILIEIILGNDKASNYDGRANINGDDYVDVDDLDSLIDLVLGDSAD